MITPFFGEFLANPIPLELSLGVCSFRCAYCFANLNQPHRRAQPGPIMRLLQEYPQRTTLTARLLQAGYPVLVANRDDAFAPSNWAQAEPILRTMTDLGIPLAFQTKGGPRVRQALAWLKPACWYVSVAMLDDRLRARVEPQAPSISDRLALIAELRSAGHRVVVGVNPAVSEWLPDAAPLVTALQQAGAEGLLVARLHLSYRQIDNLSARERAALSEPLLARARNRYPDAADWHVLARVYQAAAAVGLPVASLGLPAFTRFWQPYRELYPQTFPLLADLINYASQYWAAGELIKFSDFWALVGDRLPAGVFGIDAYLGATARQLWWERQIPPNMTFRDLLMIMWAEPKTRACPARLPLFAYLGQPAGKRGAWTQYLDESDGLPLLVYTPQGCEKLWIDADSLPRYTDPETRADTASA